MTDVERIAEVWRLHADSIEAARRARRSFVTRGARRALRRALEAEQAALHELGFEQFTDFADAAVRAVDAAAKQRSESDGESAGADLFAGGALERAHAALQTAYGQLLEARRQFDDALAESAGIRAEEVRDAETPPRLKKWTLVEPRREQPPP